jgi:hypothetical protein
MKVSLGSCNEFENLMKKGFQELTTSFLTRGNIGRGSEGVAGFACEPPQKMTRFWAPLKFIVIARK